MRNEELIEKIRRKFERVSGVLNERGRRGWAAAEAEALGYGGQSLVAQATGLSRVTRHREGIESGEDSFSLDPSPADRMRNRGGGHNKRTQHEPGLLWALEALVEPTPRGDPESPLRWTGRRPRQLAAAVAAPGQRLSHQTVAALLNELGYSLQRTQKTKAGGAHPDRAAQLQQIHDRVEHFQRRGQPVVSVDTKKKELVGDFKKGGQEWRPKGDPEQGRGQDFVDKVLGKVNPEGVQDPPPNGGGVRVGVDHDPAEVAVETLRRWEEKLGRSRYPTATELLVTAAGGGSNGARVRWWKVALQRLADQPRRRLAVCPFPPGTSKWNNLEHRLFRHISLNWRGKPRFRHAVVVNLIAGTTTRTGLRMEAELDTPTYPTGIQVTDEELDKLNIQRADFHGEWNYTLLPTT